jgi:carbon storage regulator
MSVVPWALTLQEPAAPPMWHAGAPVGLAFGPVAFTRTTCLSCRGDKEGGHHMLVLTRKSNQSIMIGDEIEISVLSIMGEKVRIGIQAPRDIPVFRKEVYLEIQAERGQVTAGGTVDEALRKLSS